MASVFRSALLSVFGCSAFALGSGLVSGFFCSFGSGLGSGFGSGFFSGFFFFGSGSAISGLAVAWGYSASGVTGGYATGSGSGSA